VVTVVLLFLVVPQILGAIAYFSLVFHTHDADQRYRITLVSTSVFVCS